MDQESKHAIASLAKGSMTAMKPDPFFRTGDRGMFISRLFGVLSFAVLTAVAHSHVRARDGLQGTRAPETKRAAEPPTASADIAGFNNRYCAAARNAYEKVWDRYTNGYGEEEEVYQWSVRLLTAERRTKKPEQEASITAFEDHLKRMRELEKLAPLRPIVVDASAASGFPEGGFGRFSKLPGAKVPGPLKVTVDKDGKAISLERANARPPHVPALVEYYRAEAAFWLAEVKARKP